MITTSPGSEAQDALVAALQAAFPTLEGVAMTWEPCRYYATQARGWHPRAEIMIGPREGGGYSAHAGAPTYAPAWLDEFCMAAHADTLDELMADLLAKVDAAWGASADRHKAKQQEQE